MATDLSYFCEEKLYRSNIVDFYDSLPDHLKKKFKKSVLTKIIWGNVLQGYRGPSNLRNGASFDSRALESSYKTQEIKFWWGIRRSINFIPIAGSVAFGIARLVQKIRGELEWNSLYFDFKTGECLGHDENDVADKLNTKGEQLFEEGKYSEAAEYHYNAYRLCSKGYQNQQTFQNHRDKAQAEVDAINLNSLGENFFKKGIYSEAYRKHESACEKSQNEREIEKYVICKNKAKVELDAIELKQLGDVEFNAGRFDTAKAKYQEAYNKTTKEKEKYMEDIKKISTIRDELRILKTLWDEGWTLENDTENDQSGEAKKSFQLVLVKSKANLEIFPHNLRLKEYETLASLKEDGNELFNQGYKFQQDGVELLQEAHKLKEQQKIKSAHEKFQEAKDKFSIAKEKFKRGRSNDDRFLICIELVQEKLNQVMHSMMEIIKPDALNQRLNDLLVGNDDQDTNGNQSSTREQYNYHEQN